MKKIMTVFLMCLSLLLTACGEKSKNEVSPSGIVEKVSEALETVHSTEVVVGDEQKIADGLFEISNWLGREIWNEGFCELSHYIGRGTNSVGGELDLEYTLHKLSNSMDKKEGYNNFILGLEDDETYKELKYIWIEKLNPEIDALYDDIQKNSPKPSDSERVFDANNLSTYSNDFRRECDKIIDAFISEAETQ